MNGDDNITLIVTRQEATALSALILETGTSGHRSASVEAVRAKLRAGLNRRGKDREEEEAELNILRLEYQRRQT
jgi:hypothetical protein